MLELGVCERPFLARIRVDRLAATVPLSPSVLVGPCLQTPRPISATLRPVIHIFAAHQILLDEAALVHFAGAHALLRLTDILVLLALDHAVAMEALRALLALIEIIENV